MGGNLCAGSPDDRYLSLWEDLSGRAKIDLFHRNFVDVLSTFFFLTRLRTACTATEPTSVDAKGGSRRSRSGCKEGVKVIETKQRYSLLVLWKVRSRPSRSRFSIAILEEKNHFADLNFPCLSNFTSLAHFCAPL